MNQSKFLVDDSGAEVTVNNGLGELLDIKNVKVVYVRDPPPGKWRLRVDSSSAHTLRITGLSKFDFAAGFAKQRPTHITSTELRPLEGRACTILLISCIWNWIRHWFHYILVCKIGWLLTRSLVCTLYLTLDCYYRCKEPHSGQHHGPWPPWSPTEAAAGQSKWGSSDRVSPPSWPRAEEHLPDRGLQTSIWLLLY